MSQQNRPPQPDNQPQHPQQPYPQQGQQTPYSRPMPPPAPAPDYQQPYPQQQPSQPETVYIEKKSNPIMMVLKVIAYPFIKLLQLIGNVFAIILQELVRSVVSFIFGVTLLIVFVALVAGYGYALYLTNFDFEAALPEMFRIFGSLIGFGG